MPDAPVPPRQYTAAEIEALLRRAAELQGAAQHVEPLQPGLTLEEVQQAAAEAGLDPRLVAEAARAFIPARALPTEASTLLGGPAPRYDFTHTFEGEVPTTLFPTLRSQIRTAMGHDDDDTPRTPAPGYGPRTFTWNHGTLNQIKVTPQNGQTHLEARGRWQTLRLLHYGGLTSLGLVAGVLFPNLIQAGSIGAMGMAAGGAIAGWLLGRFSWQRTARKLRDRLHAAVQAVAAHVQTALAPAPTGTGSTETTAEMATRSETNPALEIPTAAPPASENTASSSRTRSS